MDGSIALAELEIRTHEERSEVAQYGFVTGGVLTNVYDNTVCHSAFQNKDLVQRDADVFYNVTQHMEEPGTEAAYAFYAWLFGPWSPYRSILGSYVNDPQDVVDYGYILTDFGNAPANLLPILIPVVAENTEAVPALTICAPFLRTLAVPADNLAVITNGVPATMELVGEVAKNAIRAFSITTAPSVFT